MPLSPAFLRRLPLAARSRPETDLGSGGLGDDAFAARTAGPQDLAPAELLLKIAAWTRALAETLGERGPELPGVSQVAGNKGFSPTVGVVVRDRLLRVEGAAGRDVAALASEIGASLARGKRMHLGNGAALELDAAAVVVCDRRPLQFARRTHRAGGLRGPWLCLAQSTRSHFAPPLELLGASEAILPLPRLGELLVATLNRADALVAALPDGSFQWLGRELTRAYVDSWRFPDHGPAQAVPLRDREELLAATLHGGDGSGAHSEVAERIRAALTPLMERAGGSALVDVLDGAGGAPWPVHGTRTPPRSPAGGGGLALALRRGPRGTDLSVCGAGSLAGRETLGRVVDAVAASLGAEARGAD